MQSTDECECRYILNTDGNIGKLALEVADVGLEAVTQLHLDREEVLIVLLGFSAGGVLGEKCLGHFLEVAERMWWQGVELIRSPPFRLDGKVRHISRSLWD